MAGNTIEGHTCEFLAMPDAGYCSIYVYAPVAVDRLTADLAGLLGGSPEGPHVTGNGLGIFADENDEYDEAKARRGNGDFLYFPFILAVEKIEPTDDRRSFKGSIDRLLAGLAGRGYDFVTVADFEDDLVGRGRSRPL